MTVAYSTYSSAVQKARHKMRNGRFHWPRIWYWLNRLEGGVQWFCAHWLAGVSWFSRLCFLWEIQIYFPAKNSLTSKSQDWAWCLDVMASLWGQIKIQMILFFVSKRISSNFVNLRSCRIALKRGIVTKSRQVTRAAYSVWNQEKETFYDFRLRFNLEKLKSWL